MKPTSKYLPILLLSLLATAGGTAYANPALLDGTFTPATAVTNVPWGTNANGPQTLAWTGGQYAYDPTDIGKWVFSGGAGVQQNGSAWGFQNAPGAGQSAFLQAYNGGIPVPAGSPSSPSSISQTITGLTKSSVYYVTFDMAQRSGFGKEPVTVEVGNTKYVATAPAGDAWSEYYVEFVAQGSSEVLDFLANFPTTGSYDADTGIADVALATALPLGQSAQPISATPEPASLLLLGTALLGLALFVRRNAEA